MFFKKLIDVLRGEKTKVLTGGAMFATLAVTVSTIVSAGLTSAVPSTDQLIAHWSFDQSSGTVLADDGGNGLNGTLVQTPTWTSGQINNSLKFDGTDSVSIGNIPAINGTNKLTLATWMKRAASNARVLLGKQTTNHDLAIEPWDDGKVYFQLSNGSDTYATVNLNDTAWHHYALVYDGALSGNANRLKVYVDGVQQVVSFNGTVPATTTTNTTPFNFGKLLSDHSNGQIDDTWLYARALSATEITELKNYNGGVPTNPDTTAPTIPSNVTATATSQTQINVGWNASTDDVAVTGYRIYRNGVEQTTTTNTSYADTNLTANTSYTYTIRAYDALGNQSALSASASATTFAPVPQPTATITATPNAVANGGSSTLTWTSTDATNCTASGGWLGNKTTSGSQVISAITSQTTYTLSCAGPGGQASVSASVSILPACNDGVDNDNDGLIDGGDPGCSSANDGDETDPDTTAPSVPSNFSATAISQTQVNLSWNASTDNVAVTGYRVFRNGVERTTTMGTTFADTGLSANTSYTYTVRAYDAAGNQSADSVQAIVTTPQPTSQLSEGLVAHWSFDQSSGTTLTDDSGNGRNGTFTQTPTWTSGHINNALKFDGTDDVAIGNIPAINGVSKLTFATWMKREVSSARVLVGKQTSSHDIAIETWNDGNVYFQMSNGSEAYAVVALNDTAWHHYALVYDGALTGNANRLKVYVDGVQKTASFSGTIPATTTTNTTPFNIGKLLTDYSNGSIDDTRLYARVLSTSEINLLNNLSGTPAEPDTTVPSVSIAAPFNNSTVSGTVSVSADATDNIGVAGVKFYANGTQIGSEDTSAPFSVTWNTSALTDNTVALTAVARDAAGNTTTSAAVTVQAQNEPTPPVSGKFITSISANGRYFLDQNGQPILVKGDSPWEMMTQLSPSDVALYLDNRKSYGVNALIVSLIGSEGSGYTADGSTFDGIKPFTNGDLNQPNPVYWERMDQYLGMMRDRGMTAMLYLVDGWNIYQPQNVFTNKSIQDMYNYGKFVGERYKNYPNIMWMFGGDYFPNTNTPWLGSAEDLRMDAAWRGVKDAGADRLTSVQLGYRKSLSTDNPFWESRVDWNFVYTYYATYKGVYDGWNKTSGGANEQPGERNPRPSLFSEGNYENGSTSGGSTAELRRTALWALTAGSPGFITGQEGVWDFQSDWKNRINSTTTVQLSKIRQYFEGLEWWKLVPDQTNTLVTAGRGAKVVNDAEIFPMQNDYVTAALSSDGKLAVVYIPTTRTITLDMSKLAPGTTAVWVDPADATATPQVATIAANGQVTTPNNPRNGQNDWLLVIK